MLKMTWKTFYKTYTNRHRAQCSEKRRSGIISPLVPDKYDKEKENINKTKEEENSIYEILVQNEFLKKVLTKHSMQQFIDSLYLKNICKDDVLIEENKVISKLFISNTGSFQILKNGKLLNKFQDARIFGEVTILHPYRASKTIKAAEKGTVWVLDPLTFKNLVINNRIVQQDQIINYLKNVPTINMASNENLYNLIELFNESHFDDSSFVLKEGDVIDCFFIVIAGKGSATILSRNYKESQKKLYKGDFFGESIFQKESSSPYTIIADPPGLECITLLRTVFLNYFHDINDFLRGKISSLDRGNWKYSHVELKNLKTLKTLGCGGFGRVELVQDSKNKDDIYALKYLKKHEINSKIQIEQVYNEKKFQMACDSPFIVKLYRTFKDLKYVYFLLEPCMGGDLWNLLRRQKRKCFDSDAVKFYTGCVLEAFSYLHSKDIIYRDLKPENVMVSSNGYLKITDFGFARKISSSERAYSFVGTTEYIAPEVIQNLPHDKGVDYWALGIFIFELLVGKTPFKNDENNDEKTYKAILKGIDFVSFPFIVSPRARNLIKKLCRPLCVDRLGCQMSGVKDIQAHPWFSKLDWNKLRNLELDPPIRISLNGKTDTKYFNYVKEVKLDVAIEDFSLWDEDF